jgi:hypothetical protein
MVNKSLIRDLLPAIIALLCLSPLFVFALLFYVNQKNIKETSTEANEPGATSALTGITGELEIPPDAISWYTLSYDELLTFLVTPTIETLDNANTSVAYIFRGAVEGFVAVTRPSSNRTYEMQSGRIGNYNFDMEYYNILSNKQVISEIISHNLTGNDIENVVLLEYHKSRSSTSETTPPPGTGSRMVFWVQTTKDNYVLLDHYKHVDNDNIIHNWDVYRHNEYPW